MKQKYLALLCFNFICLTFSYSQIVNEGTLQIKPLTTVYFGDEYTNKSAATHNNDGDLYLNNNFVNNGVTSSISGTTFFKSAVNDMVTISGLTDSIHFYNLEVDLSGVSKKGVSVADNFGLYVKNAVNLSSGDLRLIGDAQLIQTHSGIGVNSSVTGTLLKDQNGYSSSYGYNDWSSPVNNSDVFSLSGGLFDGTDSSINSFECQQILFNAGSPYNGLPSLIDGGGNVTTPLTINSRWLYKYSRGIGNYASWIKINENSALAPGEGFIMKGTNSLNATQNYVFKGVPNDGEFLFPISSGESSLLGNPYPSAIDSNKFINDNLTLFDGTLYFWVEGGSPSHNLADYLGGYATRNLTAGAPPSVASSLISGLGNSNGITPPSQYMAVGQGFFIEATGNGNLIFQNSQRIFKTEGSTDSYFYKTTTSKNNKQEINNSKNKFIRIGYEDPEGFHRQLVLGFLPDSPADLSCNRGYDALMSNVREDELFFLIDHQLDKKYVIQGVGSYDSSFEFPLGLIISEAGIHTIMLDAVENFEDEIFIKDNVLNTYYDLTTGNFSPNLPPSEYLDRFSIVFKPKDTVKITEIFESKIYVRYYQNNTIQINNKSEIKLDKVFIYNMLGQKILQVNHNLLEQKEIVIPFNFKKGMYLVLIESDKGKETFKMLN